MKKVFKIVTKQLPNKEFEVGDILLHKNNNVLNIMSKATQYVTTKAMCPHLVVVALEVLGEDDICIASSSKQDRILLIPDSFIKEFVDRTHFSSLELLNKVVVEGYNGEGLFVPLSTGISGIELELYSIDFVKEIWTKEELLKSFELVDLSTALILKTKLNIY